MVSGRCGSGVKGLMLDEHISPIVAEQLRSKGLSVLVVSVHEIRGGTLVGSPDSILLLAAAQEGLTLVTFDLRTIPILMREWGAAGKAHAGILLVDQRTVRPDDYGGLVRALEAFCVAQADRDWTNRSAFLEPPSTQR